MRDIERLTAEFLRASFEGQCIKGSDPPTPHIPPGGEGCVPARATFGLGGRACGLECSGQSSGRGPTSLRISFLSERRSLVADRASRRPRPRNGFSERVYAHPPTPGRRHNKGGRDGGGSQGLRLLCECPLRWYKRVAQTGGTKRPTGRISGSKLLRKSGVAIQRGSIPFHSTKSPRVSDLKHPSS